MDQSRNDSELIEREVRTRWWMQSKGDRSAWRDSCRGRAVLTDGREKESERLLDHVRLRRQRRTGQG
jgi:hypothetical protein